MILSTGREVIEVQREGYAEVIPVDGGILTNAEWNEYADHITATNRKILAEQKINRVKTNHALFNRAQASR